MLKKIMYIMAIRIMNRRWVHTYSSSYDRYLTYQLQRVYI